MSGGAAGRIRLLALAAHPVESAATRFRIHQYIEPLRRHGIDAQLRPFLSSRTFSHFYDSRKFVANVAGMGAGLLRRLGDLAASADVLFVQRQAMTLGPPWFEWAMSRLPRRPLVYDFDDALYIPDKSPVYGRLADLLKSKRKADQLMSWAGAVLCGNETLAARARERSGCVEVLPTIVDGEEFRPAATGNDVPVIGWIGSHTTFRFVERLFPILQRLRETSPFRLLVVGSGRDRIDVPGLDVVALPWQLGRDVELFQSIDIGVYPLPDEPFARGKSGFKAIQYMFVGVPFVMSPVGVCRDLGVAGTTHFAAETDDEWYASLRTLLDSAEARAAMGRAGRSHAVATYSLERQAAAMAAVIRRVHERA